MVEYRCDKCGYTTSNKSHFNRHKEKINSCFQKGFNPTFECSHCGKKFKRHWCLKRHYATCRILYTDVMSQKEIREKMKELEKRERELELKEIELERRKKGIRKTEFSMINNTINNISINIKVNAYDNTDFSI